MHFPVTNNSKAWHFVINFMWLMTRGSNSLFCNKISTGTSCSCKKIEKYWVKQKFQGAIKLLWTKIVRDRKVNKTQHILRKKPFIMSTRNLYRWIRLLNIYFSQVTKWQNSLHCLPIFRNANRKSLQIFFFAYQEY